MVGLEGLQIGCIALLEGRQRLQVVQPTMVPGFAAAMSIRFDGARKLAGVNSGLLPGLYVGCGPRSFDSSFAAGFRPMQFNTVVIST